MFPKPPKREPKPKKPLKRTRVKKYRAKARAGRLKGEEIVQLRILCFERDGGKCVVCGIGLQLERGHWDSMEMAHIRGKRMWGDCLANVRSLCGPFANGCHAKEHNWGKSGLKPCPAKN